ncbi:competence type IV pilus assembly protein ComGB [Staphylococcus durrellii]|uniref:competence type IV pilus assembly protein ComGB n=1 Tax=Staphylococcus durrellii TaxID=2781773 RepID=UPI00189CA1A0|nr:competence type IV pilus assembly protein ComGB [Staphylococcus durrellii]MBF7017021.1 type II secretion system F family protein [Staphylococcus durrellii]
MKKLTKNIFKKYPSKIISKQEQIEFISRLNDLLTHGFTVSEAFKLLIQQTTFRRDTIKEHILATISSGANCNQILKSLRFPQSVVMFIYFAELFGDLSICLVHVQTYLERNYHAKRMLLKTIQYPIVLISIFMIMLVTMNYTIIPQFNELFKTMDVKLSPLQQFMSLFITVLPKIILYSVTFISILIIIFWSIYQRLTIPQQIKFMTFIPIINHYFRLFKTYRLASELSLFYRHGVTLQNIVKLYEMQNDDRYLKFLAAHIARGTQQGDKLGTILSKLSCYQSDLITFITQGEQSGKLGLELQFYSAIIRTKIEQRMKRQIQIIQPLTFSILAFLIIALYLVIMLPMFELIQTIK